MFSAEKKLLTNEYPKREHITFIGQVINLFKKSISTKNFNVQKTLYLETNSI